MVHLVLVSSNELYPKMLGFEQILRFGNSSIKMEGSLASGNGEIIEVFVTANTAEDVKYVQTSVDESLGGECIKFEVI
jgi:hypothetical protein